MTVYVLEVWGQTNVDQKSRKNKKMLVTTLVVVWFMPPLLMYFLKENWGKVSSSILLRVLTLSRMTLIIFKAFSEEKILTFQLVIQIYLLGGPWWNYGTTWTSRSKR